MSRYLTLLSLGMFLFVVFGEPPDPCDIPLLDFAIQSMDVPEECGEDIVIESTVNMPKHISFSQADKAKNYFLLMVDPDVTPGKNPTQKYVLHWMVENIPGAFLANDSWISMEQYHEIVGYAAPSPPPGSGPHRYQFFLHAQPSQGLADIPDITKRGKYMRFDVDTFVEVNKLDVPVAGFEYVTQNPPPGEL